MVPILMYSYATWHRHKVSTSMKRKMQKMKVDEMIENSLDEQGTASFLWLRKFSDVIILKLRIK